MGAQDTPDEINAHGQEEQLLFLFRVQVIFTGKLVSDEQIQQDPPEWKILFGIYG